MEGEPDHLDQIPTTLFRLLFILFLVVPLVEIYILIKVGGLIGAIPTIALVVFTAVLGALMLRWQGFTTLQRVRNMLARGEIPAIEMLEGVILLISGALLLTPGFFTDTLGFLCLVPPLRRGAITWLITRHVLGGRGPSRPPPDSRDQGPRTIEGEFWREKGDRKREE